MHRSRRFGALPLRTRKLVYLPIAPGFVMKILTAARAFNRRSRPVAMAM